MKKIITLTFTILLLFSCNNNSIENSNIKIDGLLKWKELNVEEKAKLNNIKINNIIEKKVKQNHIWDKKIKKDTVSINKKIDLWKKINNNIFIDLWYEKSHIKFQKKLKEIQKILLSWKIDTFELHCKNINFNKNELDILTKIKVNKFILEDTCWFRKKEFSKTWYDKNKLLKFFKKSKYIKELYIWAIDYDFYKKENWKIKENLFF